MIQVYQVKMKNYKRIPIPQALYQIMKVYLKKHEIQPEEFIFKNNRGGACLYGIPNSDDRSVPGK